MRHPLHTSQFSSFFPRPFVSNLYEVVSVDINYFFQYGQEVWYKANHKRAEQSYKGVTSSAAELAFIKGDDIQGWCCFEMQETLELLKNDIRPNQL